MTKLQILNELDKEKILLFFLNLSEIPKKNISSPFSKDSNESFKVFKNATYKCFSTGKQGDCFQLVADLNNIDNKTNFNEVINIITEKMNLIKEHKIEKSDFQDTENHYNFQTKEFLKIHLDYFLKGNWNVTEEILKKYNVFALDKFEFFNSKKQEISKIKLFNNILGFAYTCGNSSELYIPKQEKTTKFFLNKFNQSDIFGLEQITSKVPYIIISAGKKDCLILNANGFPAVTFRSENHFIKDAQIKKIQKKCDHIFICYDNDDAGQNAQQIIVERFAPISPIIFDNKYNDIADYFLENSKNDFQKLFSIPGPKKEIKEIEVKEEIISTEKTKEVKPKKEKKQVYTIFHKTEDFLSKNYNFRYNNIKNQIEIQKKEEQNWKILNENNLYLELQKNSIRISLSNLNAILKSDFTEDFNPIQNYFSNLPEWDGTDYITNLSSYILAYDKTYFSEQFKKWLVRAVFCAMDDSYFNKQALVLVSNQNDGKTSFFNWLSPPVLREYYTDRITTDKDGIISLARNFMINIDELASLNKQDTKQLKALFSMKNINIRVPFGKNEANLLRRCSFVGSTNEQTFLSDETGSVRWLCFNIHGINWNYSKECNLDLIWSQAYSLYKSTTNRNQWDMTKIEISINEKHNKQFKINSVEYELINKYFQPVHDVNKKDIGEHLSSTEIMLHLKPLVQNLNNIAIGRALTALNFIRTKEDGKYGYRVIKENVLPIPFNQ